MMTSIVLTNLLIVIASIAGAIVALGVTALCINILIWLFEFHKWRNTRMMGIGIVLRGVAKLAFYIVFKLASAIYQGALQLTKDTTATNTIKNL